LGAATALLLIAGARASQAATPIFVVDTDTASTSLIFRVDPATGHLTTLMSLAASYGQVLALAAASDNLLYAVASNGDVLQLTVTPPTLTTLGNIGAHFVAGLEYSGGQLYAIDEATDALSTIQLAPVVQTTIGVIHVGSPSGPVLDIQGADLAQDGAGLWYLWTNGTQALYQLDVTTAVATQVGPAGLGAKTGLAFDYQGGNVLYGASRPLDTLQTIDTATGQTTASVNFCLNCPTVYDLRFGDLAAPRCIDATATASRPRAARAARSTATTPTRSSTPGRPSSATGSTTTATARSTIRRQ
jgi:hypothetical protein